MTTVDPLQALVTVFQTNVSYDSDDSTPATQDYSNNGLDVQIFPYGKKKQRIVPLIEVGPIQHTRSKPANIGNSPNSRWLYTHFIECHILSQTYQSPNISAYNAMIKIWESVRQVLIQKQTTADGSGNWLLMKLSNGPYLGPETTVTPDRYDLAFVVELWRSVVN